MNALLDALDVYTPVSELPRDYPQERLDLVKNIFHDRWRIFNPNFDSKNIYKILISICRERYSQQPELFDGPVGIRQDIDENFLDSCSILKKYQWNDFVDGIKYTNRFHDNHLNSDQLIKFLSCTQSQLSKGEIFYRARICPNCSGFALEDMSAPPTQRARAGRINPEGIRVLYLSNERETTIYEVRAGVYDYVCVGRFELSSDIKIVDFTMIDKISPFALANSDVGIDLLQYAVNIDHLRKLADEVSRPLRNESFLDYLPTQYICDLIHSVGFDGIKYKSSFKVGGFNLALFNPDVCRCCSVEVLDIDHIYYQHSSI